jgi:hypothetical protein
MKHFDKIIVVAVALACALTLTACATVKPIIEYQHQSHISQHVGRDKQSEGINSLSAGIRWTPYPGATVDILDGYSIEAVHNRHELFTGRVTFVIGGAK